MPRRVLVLLLVLTTQCDALSLERISSLRGSSVREAQRMLETTNPPTVAPSRPTAVPTVSPTFFPSGIPTGTPSGQPTEQPSGRPSGQPSVIPTGQPSEQPSQMPTRPTGQPSQMPTGPTSQPTQMPTMPTNTPSGQPSGQPTEYPSGVPSSVPTSEPSRPTFEPTHRPTLEPTPHPTAEPTTATPTAVPTTAVPTTAPTAEPSTATPTAVPTLSPTPVPTRRPTPAPSPVPTTATPTRIPTPLPSATPTVRPTPEPSFKPTAFPSRSPTEQSIEDKYAEALLTDRLVYVIIGVAVLLILMCCLCFYCCASYGIPSLCLIAKTRVAKVYVDERGSEIQDFERRYRRPKSAERPRHAEHSNRRASAGSIVSATPGSVVGNRGRGESAESLSSIPEGQTRPASPEPTHRRHTTVSNESSMVPLGAPLVAMSPLSGVQHSESPALRNALDRKQEADSRPLTSGLPPRPAANSTPGPGADTPGADPMLAAMHGRPDPDESPATMQFNLQMWIRNLMATNDSLRQQLGLPLHVKSTRKINELVSSTSALSVSEINLLVQHAQDLSDENTSLQRLVDSGEVATGGESDDDRGRNKKRPRSSPTHRSKASSSSPKKVSQKQPIAEENSILSIEESNVESSAMDASAEMPPAEKRPSVSSKSSKAGRRSSDVLVKDHFKNDDGNSLPRRALGYKEEPELVSQTPAPDASRAQSEKKNKTEPNFVRVAKNSGKGETLEDIAKHDKIQHRKEFARKLYKQTST